MKKIEKILLGIEGLIYVIVFGCIIYQMCNFRYVKVANLNGLLQYTGIGMVLPAVVFVAACILLKKGKKIIGRVMGILLVPYLIVTCLCGFMLALGGITHSETDNLEHYKQYDKEVVKMLERYLDILPEKEEQGMTITNYKYEYMRTLDDNFSIYVDTAYQKAEELERKTEQLKEEFGVTILQEDTAVKKYQYGEWLIECDMEQKKIVYTMEY